MEYLELILAYLQGQNVWWGLLLLTLSAGVEYLVPPFPGDTVTLVGAVLVPAAGWPLWGVFVAVMLGSMAGSALNWWLGWWIADNEDRDTWFHRFLNRPKVAKQVGKLIDQFERHGSTYIALNRFVPAFRSLFFISAGLAKLPLERVMFFAAISAAAWNAAIVGVGYVVGYNLDELAALLNQYTRAFWILFGVTIAAWLGIKVVRWLRRRSGTEK